MTKWSYTYEQIPTGLLGPHLTNRGRDGWELCAVRTIDETTVELYFKRPDGASS